MREVDLAVFADAVAGEHAALAARVERVRRRLTEAAIERKARVALPADAVGRLEELGLLRALDPAALRTELRELAADLDAVGRLQAWVEAELVRVSAA